MAFIPQTVPMESIGDTVGNDFDFESFMSYEFLTTFFSHIDAGEERLFVILRADSYTYDEIAWMAGKKKDYVERVLSKVRNKLRIAGVAPHLTKTK